MEDVNKLTVYDCYGKERIICENLEEAKNQDNIKSSINFSIEGKDVFGNNQYSFITLSPKQVLEELIPTLYYRVKECYFPTDDELEEFIFMNPRFKWKGKKNNGRKKRN